MFRCPLQASVATFALGGIVAGAPARAQEAPPFDDAVGWKTYLDLGVDALFTNDPAGAIAFLKKDGMTH